MSTFTNSRSNKVSNKYVIIDNRVSAINLLRESLKDLGIEDSRIFAPGTTGGSTIGWTNAEESIALLGNRGWDPKKECIVLFLDIALDENDQGVDDGIARLDDILDSNKEFVRILYSGKTDKAREKLRPGQFDGILSKSRFRKNDDEKWKAAFLRSVIGNAISAWKKRNPNVQAESYFDRQYQVEDSLALRLFEASYGKEALGNLVNTLAQGTSADETIFVQIASGGYSGATVVLLRYGTTAGERRIAVKLDRRKELLDKELSKIQEVSAAAHKWAELPLPVIQGAVTELPSAKEALYYFTQAFFKGETLADAATKELFSPSQVSVLGKNLTEVTLAGISDARAIPLAEAFELTEEDGQRFFSSSKRIVLLKDKLSEFADIKKNFIDLGFLEKSKLESLVADWVKGSIDFRFREVIAYEQHGDLNPRNVMILRDDGQMQVKFIDFAKFGLWPALYDLRRLKLQLALELFDSPATLSDCFPDRVSAWEHLWVELSMPSHLFRRKKRSGTELGFANFVSISKAISDLERRVIEPLGESEKRSLEYAAKLGELWDLIRMTSYQDASWFKRLWFYIRANKLCRELFPSA